MFVINQNKLNFLENKKKSLQINLNKDLWGKNNNKIKGFFLANWKKNFNLVFF